MCLHKTARIYRKSVIFRPSSRYKRSVYRNFVIRYNCQKNRVKIVKLLIFDRKMSEKKQKKAKLQRKFRFSDRFSA